MAGYSDIIFSLPDNSPYKLGRGSGGGGEPALPTRFFKYNTNGASNEHGRMSDIVFTAVDDWEISFKFVVTNTGKHSMFLSDSSTTDTYLYIEAGGGVGVNLPGMSSMNTGPGAVSYNVVHDITLRKDVNTVECLLDGVVVLTSNEGTFAVVFDRINGWDISTSFAVEGFCYDMSFKKNNVEVAFYPMDEASGNVFRDTVGRNDGTYVNILDVDYGEFEITGTEYRGKNLDSPPWPTADSIFPVAV